MPCARSWASCDASQLSERRVCGCFKSWGRFDRLAESPPIRSALVAMSMLSAEYPCAIDCPPRGDRGTFGSADG